MKNTIIWMIIVLVVFAMLVSILHAQTPPAPWSMRPSDFSQIADTSKQAVAISTSGQTWLRIRSSEKNPGTYKPETTIVESDNEPVVVKSGNRWVIRFRPR